MHPLRHIHHGTLLNAWNNRMCTPRNPDLVDRLLDMPIDVRCRLPPYLVYMNQKHGVVIFSDGHTGVIAFQHPGVKWEGLSKKFRKKLLSKLKQYNHNVHTYYAYLDGRYLSRQPPEESIAAWLKERQSIKKDRWALRNRCMQYKVLDWYLSMLLHVEQCAMSEQQAHALVTYTHWMSNPGWTWNSVIMKRMERKYATKCTFELPKELMRQPEEDLQLATMLSCMREMLEREWLARLMEGSFRDHLPPDKMDEPQHVATPTNKTYREYTEVAQMLRASTMNDRRDAKKRGEEIAAQIMSEWTPDRLAACASKDSEGDIRVLLSGEYRAGDLDNDVVQEVKDQITARLGRREWYTLFLHSGIWAYLRKECTVL